MIDCIVTVGIFLFKYNFGIYTVGERQSQMIVGKLVIGSINGSCANFIINNEIGYACVSGDSEALANLIKELDINKLREIGKHSKEVYYKKYGKELFINRLIEELNKLVNHNS